ncbi:MAG: hypothetical protein JNM02_06690 [Anaerolineales bacterium]|nr:hypothetical protein [Anaerolineales bacterium]
MNQHDVTPPALTLSSASLPDPRPVRRLIVLVPESEAAAALAARKIWELANAFESEVQLLGLSRDAAHEPGLRRQLVTLSALVEGDKISVKSKIEFGNNWLRIVESEWREGDVIVCFEGQRLGLAHRPLNQILESKFNSTVYVLASDHHERETQRSSWIFNTLAWAGSIGIILGFFWAQARLTQLPQSWTGTSLLYISLFVEAGLLWFWNSLFG